MCIHFQVKLCPTLASCKEAIRLAKSTYDIFVKLPFNSLDNKSIGLPLFLPMGKMQFFLGGSLFSVAMVHHYTGTLAHMVELEND